MRNQGWGSMALALAVEHLFATTDISRVIAAIKDENKASLRAFEKAGFEYQGKDRRKGSDCVIMIKEREKD
jgi:RimJ/RimL family protein N-acetyltransferase